MRDLLLELTPAQSARLRELAKAEDPPAREIVAQHNGLTGTYLVSVVVAVANKQISCTIQLMDNGKVLDMLSAPVGKLLENGSYSCSMEDGARREKISVTVAVEAELPTAQKGITPDGLRTVSLMLERKSKLLGDNGVSSRATLKAAERIEKLEEMVQQAAEMRAKLESAPEISEKDKALLTRVSSIIETGILMDVSLFGDDALNGEENYLATSLVGRLCQ